MICVCLHVCCLDLLGRLVSLHGLLFGIGVSVALVLVGLLFVFVGLIACG